MNNEEILRIVAALAIEEETEKYKNLINDFKHELKLDDPALTIELKDRRIVGRTKIIIEPAFIFDELIEQLIAKRRETIVKRYIEKLARAMNEHKEINNGKNQSG